MIIPVSVNVTVGNLLRGAKASVMVDLLERAGLDWILAGRQPTRDEITALGIVRPPPPLSVVPCREADLLSSPLAI